jgi:hypothetical protein
MIILYELRNKLVKTISPIAPACPLCQANASLTMQIFQNYVWCFAPMFPSGKSAVINCGSCQKTLPVKSYTTELDAIYRAQKKEVGTPFKYISGTVGFLAFFILFFSVLIFIDKRAQKDYTTEINNAVTNISTVNNGDVLFVGVMQNNNQPLNFKLLQIQKILPDSAAVCFLSKQSFSAFTSNLNTTDYSAANFEPTPIEIDISNLQYNEAIFPRKSATTKNTVSTPLFIYYYKLN